MANLVSLISNALVAQQNTTVQQRTNTVIKPISKNPFANPFINDNINFNSDLYAKNRPVQGGYFAGYYNGKQNIVGRRLFIEA